MQVNTNFLKIEQTRRLPFINDSLVYNDLGLISTNSTMHADVYTVLVQIFNSINLGLKRIYRIFEYSFEMIERIFV